MCVCRGGPSFLNHMNELLANYSSRYHIFGIKKNQMLKVCSSSLPFICKNYHYKLNIAFFFLIENGYLRFIPQGLKKKIIYPC